MRLFIQLFVASIAIGSCSIIPTSAWAQGSTLSSNAATAKRVFDPSEFNPAQCVEYERQLNAMLLTRTAAEKKYVHDVVELVKLGELPAKLVATSYDWIRNERPYTNYPFVYFVRVLELQSAKLKLKEDLLPEFDFSQYGSAGQRTADTKGFAGQRSAIQRAMTRGRATGRSAGQTFRR